MLPSFYNSALYTAVLHENLPIGRILASPLIGVILTNLYGVLVVASIVIVYKIEIGNVIIVIIVVVVVIVLITVDVAY